MTAMMVPAVLVGFAVFVLLPPHPAQRLGQRHAARVPAWLRPVAGAPPGKVRVAAGLLAGLSWGLLAGRISGLAWWLAPIAAATVFWWLSHVPGRAHERRRRMLRSALPEACTLLAVCVESGLPFRLAVDVVATAMPEPMGAVLGTVRARTDLGVDDALAWASLADDPDLGATAREVARFAGAGTALAGILREQAREARRDAQSEAVVRARAVGVRSVLPLMTCYLPAFFLIGVVPVIGAAASRIFG